MSIAEEIQFNQTLITLTRALVDGMLDADAGKPFPSFNVYENSELQQRYALGYNKVKAMQREQARERLAVGR